MGEPTIGPLLRALRQQAGRSQSEQARELSTLAYRSVTRNEVSRWETERRLLTPFWQEHYAASFSVPVSELRAAVDACKAQRRREKGADLVERRQFMGVMTGLALPIGAYRDLPDGRRIGRHDVDQLYRQTARLRRLDDVMGGADTYRLYAQQVANTRTLLDDGRYTSEVGRSLRSLLAEQAQQAGWAAFDAGQHGRALGHYRESFDAAKAADDEVLAGNALAFVAYQQTTTTGDGGATATASYETAREAASPRVGALLLERKAWAHAVAGDAREAEQALGMARESLHRVDDRSEPDWVFWVDEREIDIMAGRCWTELRRPLRAVPVLERVLSEFPDTNARDKALYLTWLASAYWQAGEVEQAAETTGRAFDLAVGVGSTRPGERIRSLARDLGRHRGVPEVAALLDRFT